jgi:adenylylsulfate kinase-like enzyme
MGAIVFWLFGRSAAGKTTLASRLLVELRAAGQPVVELDGDQMRAGLSSDLGFSAEARLENHRRLAEVAKLISDQGVMVVVASMAPLSAHRTLVGSILGDRLRWVHVDASLETCIERDPKRLYQRARAGGVPLLLEFPFDAPAPGDRMLHLVTDSESVEQTAHRLIEWARTQR